MLTMAARERKRYFCGHCNDYIGKTLYHKHKQVYYNKKEKKWCQERVVVATDDAFVFTDGKSSSFSCDNNYHKKHNFTESDKTEDEEQHFDELPTPPGLEVSIMHLVTKPKAPKFKSCGLAGSYTFMFVPSSLVLRKLNDLHLILQNISDYNDFDENTSSAETSSNERELPVSEYISFWCVDRYNRLP